MSKRTMGTLLGGVLLLSCGALICVMAFLVKSGQVQEHRGAGSKVRASGIATREPPAAESRDQVLARLERMVREANAEAAAGRFDSAVLILRQAREIEQRYQMTEAAFGLEHFRMMEHIIHRTGDPLKKLFWNPTVPASKKRHVLALLREVAEGKQISSFYPGGTYDGAVAGLMRSEILGRQRRMAIFSYLADVVEKECLGRFRGQPPTIP